MPSAGPPPLSPTVTNIFDRFIKRLTDEKILGKSALDSLRQALNSQKLDHDSLRAAMFTPSEPPQ
jgi:hypothetical protein